MARSIPAGAQEKFKFAFVSHGSIQYPYFVKLKKGMEDACEQVKAECQFVEIVNIANIEEQLRALETVLVKGVDGIVIPLINDDIFDEPIQRAIDQGIPVLTATVDDTEGAAGNARLAFIGGNLPQTGYTLTEALSEFFPAEGDVHVLLGIQAFDQTWAIQRASRGVRAQLRVRSRIAPVVPRPDADPRFHPPPHQLGELDLRYWRQTQAAKDMGVNTDRVKMSCFMLCSVLAGFAGMLQSFRLGGSPLANLGLGIELEAIASTVIGGTVLFGGVGSIFGAVVGTLLIRSIDNGLVMGGVEAEYFRAALGGLIVFAVLLNTYISRWLGQMRT